MECANSALCLFDKEPFQTDIQNSFDVNYYPLSALGGGNPIEFHIPGTVEEYIDCDHIFLETTVKITKKDDTNIDTGTNKVGFINLVIASLFSDVSLTISDTQVEGGQCMYSYAAYLSTLMQFTPQAQKSHMTVLGWKKDEAGKMEDDANKGFVDRMAWTKDSKEVTFIGPVYCDFFRQSRYLLSQTDMRLKFTLNRPEFALMGLGVGTDFKFAITKAVLRVRRVTVNPSVINGHSIGLDRQNAIYPVLHTDIKNFTIPKGQSNYTKDNLYPLEAPKMLMIAMITNESFNGDYKKNPYNFHHFNLSRLGLFANGIAIPGRPVTPDFKRGTYVESYVDMMDAYHYFNTDDTNGLTYEDFGGGFTIYAFDLTPDKSVTDHRKHLVSLSNLRLELKFDSPLPETINVILHATFDSHIEITKLRDVIPTYTR